MRTRYLLPWLASAALILALLPSGIARAGHDVAEPFRAYYDQHQGLRVLGFPLTGLMETDGYVSQYFEKGRIEDHRAEQIAPDWAFMFGRLTAELIERAGWRSVSGTALTYAELKRHHDPTQRRPVPDGFAGGVAATQAGLFVPYDPQLRPAPGYVVPSYFWSYITRPELFPGGWLHDIGLPMTDAFQVKTYKNGRLRDIIVQAFERTVLTYDSRNPPDWQVERGNIGADAVRLLPPLNTIEIPAPDARVTLPLHVLARTGWPGDTLTVTLRWEDGTKLIRTWPVLRGEDGRGVLVDSLDIPPEQLSLHPWTQAALLEISDARETVLARQSVIVLHPDDPDTREIKLYWVVGEQLKTELRRIPQTSAIEAAALDELLWGPGAHNAEGFTTALPMPAEVLAFSSRTAEWGPRVTLRKVTLADGIAQADFSTELRTYGGRSLRASLIHAQITRTLLQFSEVHDAQITIAGERDAALEP